VIVAVRAVGVMTVAVDDVVDVIFVLHRFVAARRAVDVLGVVTFANMGGAGFGAHALSYGPE